MRTRAGETVLKPMNFAMFAVGDAYSTEAKIMGRQSAGKAMVSGIARAWPSQTLHAFGMHKRAGNGLARILMDQGHTGTVRWRQAPGDADLDTLGAVYVPAPVPPAMAHARNERGPTSYSLFGVTHTLSSLEAMDIVSSMVLPPYKPWDALICTSRAAVDVVTWLQDEMREVMARETGATRFNPIQLPMIPLGIDAPTYTRTPQQIADARAALSLGPDDVAVLFAGRLAFHAKANPAVLYQALEKAAARTSRRLVLIEAGIFPNLPSEAAFRTAQHQLSPSVQLIPVDGQDETRYRQAWQAADIFASLADNIQETFGLTPLEAMAAGLPVLVSDWDGYKDTVRDGVDGYRIPVTLPPAGTGHELARNHAIGNETYDFYVGRVSVATVVDTDILADRIVALADDEGLRRRLGEAGARRATEEFDWPVILQRYVDMVEQLGDIRRAAGVQPPVTWTSRPDPFTLFGRYPTATLGNDWTVSTRADASALERMLELELGLYALKDGVFTPEIIQKVHHAVATAGEARARDVAGLAGVDEILAIRAVMWLAKFDLASLRP